jgi:hypothetical protein
VIAIYFQLISETQAGTRGSGTLHPGTHWQNEVRKRPSVFPESQAVEFLNRCSTLAFRTLTNTA